MMRRRLLFLLPFIVILLGLWLLTKSRLFFSAPGAFAELKEVITREYAYLDSADFPVDLWLAEFEKQAQRAKTREEFRERTQAFLNHFSDPHLSLGPFGERDFCVIPTGSDMWVRREADGSYQIVDVKGKGAASVAGIRPSDVVVTIDGLSVGDAIKEVLGEAGPLKFSEKQLEYAANVALGGRRNQARTIELIHQGRQQRYQLPSSYASSDQSRSATPISYELLNTQTGYIRFNNSLGDKNTVTAFANALRELQYTRTLIVDLRDTPSGGGTDVANPILGHFTKEPSPYQKYRTQTRDTPYQKAKLQTALTEPSEPQFANNVLVLVGRWTGSMGEGMAIGFDALGATVVGSSMAHLLGGVKIVGLPSSESRLKVGFDRMYHVNGTFREDFVPPVLVNPADVDSAGEDPALAKALELARRE